LGVDTGATGDLLLDGHSSVIPVQGSAGVIAVPTIVRTGTGSIDIAAAGDFALLDHTAPGVVYTAGTIQAAPANDAASLVLGGGAVRSSSAPA
jgi:hypothetical protein